MLKFTEVTAVKFWQVYSDVDLTGTFFKHSDAYNKAAEEAAKGNSVTIYEYSHHSSRVVLDSG